MAKFAPRQAGLSKLVLLLIILVVIFLASGTALGLYFAGVFNSDPAAQIEEGAELAEGEEAVPAAPKEPLKAPIYIPIEPALVVNFDRNGRMGFLQANIQLMTRETGMEQQVVAHLPVIRNDLLLLLGSKTYADVATREGKESLRAEALAEVNRILEEADVTGRIEEIYFTGFVMQ